MELTIHLPPSAPGSYAEPSILVRTAVTQSHIDGIIALIHWCEAHEHAKGRVPGAYELTMFWRTLRGNIQEELRLKEPKPKEPKK